ncbi:hypothetical protein PTSG_11218 [Salpingoeca rosetta]|uniref:Uncharacterized protein n=1 Tax=Salpingoeca rosetta (strain ATCC 50818 / BSB-021) TaxID=946362 RepID=F2USS1_SALR5|nr:uncharacterized protein PTSG_11218 [Salpingoeca rosetta]EGD81180.1 hypothetical protein PTSG_11218 [Salpingoeca rosetta]|eukprot:XP_004987715.1 hypothetical protein PTSG_11218 [Salpingoeca rosetta]
MTLSVIKPLLSLTASNVRHLTIVAPSAKIDKLSVHHVERMTWDTAAEEVTFDADFRDVQHICLRRLGHRADFSALAGIPCVELASDDAANSFDLAPLEGVKHLALRNTRVLGEEPVILAAQRLDLTGVNLEAAKLHANRVQLCRMAAAPELLHLPNATHIELLEDCKVKRITCPLHIERLVIRHPNTHAGAAPVELPQFEHAGTVVLDFGGAKLTRAQLTSLGARSDHLVLCNCVNNIRDLCDVPPHVYVCVAGAHVDAEVPLCVKELKASIKSSFRASFVRTVPYLMLSGQRTMKAIPDTNNLSDHVFLSLKACAIDGAIRNCLRASIDGCVGRATFNCIGALSIHHGDLAFTRFERADFEVEGVEDVCTCRLWHCDIDEPFSLRATQRLIVRVSTFYEAIVVEPVNTLVVRGCGSGYGNGRWPYATLARPTHERTQLMERLREKDRVEWERRREEESWEDWSPLFDDTEYESDDDDDGDEDADGDDDGDDDDDGDGGGEDDDSDDGEC